MKYTPTEPENSSSSSSGVEDNIPDPQSLAPSTPHLPTSTSLRKRKRKGIPFQSPLQWDQIAKYTDIFKRRDQKTQNKKKKVLTFSYTKEKGQGPCVYAIK